MNRLPRDKRILILNLLVEGASMRTIARTAGVSIDAGEFCASYYGATVRNVTAKRIQCDEAWAFVYAKQKNVETAKAAPEFAGACGPGRPWTPTASWSSYAVGGRDAGVAYEFMHDLKDRLANRVQLTTDGHAAYLEAVEDAFGGAIDYAMLVKVYGEAQRKRGAATARPSARAST